MLLLEISDEDLHLSKEPSQQTRLDGCVWQMWCTGDGMLGAGSEPCSHEIVGHVCVTKFTQSYNACVRSKTRVLDSHGYVDTL